MPKRDRFISAGFIWANVISTTKGPGAFVVVFALVDVWDMPYNLPSSPRRAKNGEKGLDASLMFHADRLI
jgi:hypothetical protein